MFRGEINGHHENQQICLRVFPPQVTAGESAVAQLEPVGLSRPRPGQDESPWDLVCDETPLGRSPSFSAGIPVRFDQPGRKRLLATSRGGPGPDVFARTDLIVHGQVDDEIAAIVAMRDEFGAWPWFRSVLDRHAADPAYKEALDLILCRHLASPVEAARKTAFSLLVQMHERGLRKTAAKFLKRDVHTTEDVLQEARRRAWRSLHRLEPGKRFGPWIHAALLNACKDAKKGALLTTGSVDPEARHHDQAMATIDARDTVDHVTKGFDRDDVAMLTLRYGHDERYIDIAKALDIQPDRPDPTRVSTVRRRVERLRRDLGTARGFRGDASDAGGIA